MTRSLADWLEPFEKAWKEMDHPRAEGGQFSVGGGAAPGRTAGPDAVTMPTTRAYPSAPGLLSPRHGNNGSRKKRRWGRDVGGAV